MAYTVFIDGKEGTTGLKIYERFEKRNDIEIMHIDEDKRKDPAERSRLINESDYTFLCLPDAASRESAALCTNPHTKILDASTAHRTNPEWAYGFPELSSDFRKKITESHRVAVPGCYASGFNAIVYPLVHSGIMGADYPVVCHGISGYSGAGKKAIATYTDPNRESQFDAPRQYALSQEHKHLPEMQLITGLSEKPIMNPYVCDYFAGMTMSVPIHTRLLAKKMTAHDIWDFFNERYAKCRFVSTAPFMGEGVLPDGFIPANALAGTNRMEIFVCGNDERVLVCSRFDNLGKGASGAAVQCMNIMMGIDEATGLV